jgi:hypothetical protein
MLDFLYVAIADSHTILHLEKQDYGNEMKNNTTVSSRN